MRFSFSFSPIIGNRKRKQQERKKKEGKKEEKKKKKEEKTDIEWRRIETAISLREETKYSILYAYAANICLREASVYDREKISIHRVRP